MNLKLETPNTPDSEHLFERFSVRPVLFMASIMTLGLWTILFIPINFFKFHLFHFMGFFFSYVLTFLILYVIVFITLVLVYRHNALQMKIFSNVPIFGIYPQTFMRRTGLPYVDILGVILGIFFCIITLLFTKVHCLFPFFVFTTLSFLFAILSGVKDPWMLLRRKRF